MLYSANEIQQAIAHLLWRLLLIWRRTRHNTDRADIVFPQKTVYLKDNITFSPFLALEPSLCIDLGMLREMTHILWKMHLSNYSGTHVDITNSKYEYPNIYITAKLRASINLDSANWFCLFNTNTLIRKPWLPQSINWKRQKSILIILLEYRN